MAQEGAIQLASAAGSQRQPIAPPPNPTGSPLRRLKTCYASGMVNGARPSDEVIRARLSCRREEIESLAECSTDQRKPVELDQTRVGRLSRMDALQDQAMALETDRRRNAELDRIEAALKRLEDGDYGWCLSCGEQIPAKRLELGPTVALCVDCAEQQAS